MVLQIIAESHSLLSDIDKRLKSCLSKWQSWISTQTANKLLSSFKEIPNTVGEIKIEIQTALLIPKYTNEDIKINYSFSLNRETKTLYYICNVDLELDDVLIEPYLHVLAHLVPRAEFDIFDKLINNVNYFSYVSYDMISFLGNDSYLISHTNFDGQYFYQSKTKSTPSRSQINSSNKTKHINRAPTDIARKI